MKLGLGTVQFGMDYGISNKTGKTPAAEVAAILDLAAMRGVRVIDTAHLYGDSEEVLGKFLPESGFDIVTKTPSLRKPLITQDDCDEVRRAFTLSLERLKKEKVYGLLLHHAGDAQVAGGKDLLGTLSDLKREGKIEKIGVSVYDMEQIDFLTENFDIDLVQLPLNVFDQRLVSSRSLKKLKTRGIEIHVRSAFLQGVVFMEAEDVPVSGLRPALRRFHKVVKARGISPVSAALAFVAGLEEVDCVICGVNSAAQFKALCDEMEQLPDLPAGFFDEFAINDVNLVNPANW